jgi:hypothetical protein
VVVSTKTTSTTTTDSSLSVNVTYYYQVRGFNYGFVPTGYTTILAKATLATAPNGLSSPSQTNRTLDLQWSSNGNPSGTRYDLERSPNGSSSWAVVLNKSTDTTYTDTGLAELTTYYFRVRAFNYGQAATSYSSTLSTTTLWTPPGGISSLVATPGTNDGEIDLSWVAPGNDGASGTVQSYLVRTATFSVTATNFYDANVSTYSQSWTSLKSAGQIETRTVNGFNPSTTYYFAIKGQDAVGAASWDHTANAGRFTYAKDLVPPAPTWNSWSVGDHSITIFWNAPSIPDLSGFILDRSTNSDFSGSLIRVYGSGTTSGIDSGLLNETTYYYRIRAFDTPPVVSTSAYSTILSTATPDTEPPGQVTGFVAAQGGVEGELKLTWTMPGDDYYTKNLVNGSSFRIKVSTNASYSWNSSDYTTQASTTASPGTSHSVVLGGLSAGATYYARIWVLDEKGNTSSLSVGATNWAQVDVTPPSQISPPAVTAHWHQVQLSWTAPGDDAGSGTLNGKFEIAYSSLSDITNLGQFQAAPGQISISTSITPGSNVGYAVTGLVTGVTYYFSVRALDERNNASPISSSVNSFPTNSAPAAFTLTSPSDNAIVTTNQPLLDWSDSSDSDTSYGDSISYTISYSTSSAFETNITTTVTGLTSSQHTPLSLQEDKTIYWKVSVLDVDGVTVNGTPTPMRVRINVTNSAPSAFNLLSPSNQSLANPHDLTLDWEDSIDSDPGDSVSYLVEMSTTASLTPLTLSSVTTASTLSVTGLVENATYYWRVTASDSMVNTVSSTFWFSINATPEPPQSFSLISPASDQRIQTQTPTLSWQDTIDPDPGGSFTFKIYYSTFSNFSSNATVSVTTTTYTLPSQPDNTNYYWFVQAVDNTGLTRDSQQSRHFYIDLVKQSPLSFQLSSPINDVTLSDLQPVFTWEAAVDPDPFDTVRYSLELSVNDSSFSGVQGIPTGVDNFFVPTTDLIDHTTYFWRVKSGGYQGIPPHLVDPALTVSPVFSFRLDTINILPQAFDLLSPADGGSVDTQKPTLTWSESEDTADDVVTYSVQVATSVAFGTITVSTSALSNLSWTVPTKLSEEATYYWRVIAKDKSNAETVSTQNNRFFVPVLTRLRHPNGISGSFTADLSSGTITWFPVTENTDGSSAIDLAGYHVYRALSAAAAGESSPFATVSAASSSWTDTVLGGTVYFYMVRAFDESGIESADSAVVQAGDQTNNFILSPKKDLVITMDAETSAKLISADGEVRRLTLTENEDVSGRILKSYEIKVENESNGFVVDGFKFYRPVKLAFSLSGLSSSAVSPSLQTSSLSPTQTAVYWFNGVEFVKMGGAFDSGGQWITLQTVQAGQYQVRQVVRAASFELGRVWPSKTFTPNGDGVNDVIHFVFENPKDAPVSGKVFNLQGAFIANLSPGTDGSSLEWDGKEEGGQPAPKGVYIYQIVSDGKTMNGTIVVAR